MTRRYDLVAAGLTTLDVTVRSVDALPEGENGTIVETIRLSPAGTAAGAALVAARLGLSVAVASAVGRDPQGRIVCELLEDEGVSTALIGRHPEWPTSTTVLPIRSDGGRPTIHMLGASMLADLEDAAWDALPHTAAVHWGGVGFPGIGESGQGFLKAAKEAGAFVTCDLIAPSPASIEDLPRLLPHVDLFMPSLAEVEYLSGTEDIDAAAAHFMRLGAGGCVFKLGERGAVLITADRRIHVPAFRIEPVDTTSCGDSFCAGFHVARARGMSLEDAMRFASATAAQVASAVGTLGTLVDYETTRAYAADMPVGEKAEA